MNKNFLASLSLLMLVVSSVGAQQRQTQDLILQWGSTDVRYPRNEVPQDKETSNGKLMHGKANVSMHKQCYGQGDL